MAEEVIVTRQAVQAHLIAVYDGVSLAWRRKHLRRMEALESGLAQAYDALDACHAYLLDPTAADAPPREQLIARIEQLTPRTEAPPAEPK